MTISHEYGWVHDVTVEPIGTALAEDALAGAEVLYVEDASVFDADGGALLLGEDPMAYLSADDETDTVVLAGPLAVEYASEAGESVMVWDVDRSRVAAEAVAYVEFANGDGDADPIPAAISGSVDLREGGRGGQGETVLLERDGPSWRVIDVLGGSVFDDDDASGARLLAAPDLIASSSPYVVAGGAIRARVELDWTAVTNWNDGDPFGPGVEVTGYDVDVFAGVPGPDAAWLRAASTGPTTLEAAFVDLPPGEARAYRVRAVAGPARLGEWSAAVTVTTGTDVAGPKTPSAALLSTRLGTVTARWDGRANDGSAMDADTAYAEIHQSAVSGFAPVPGDLNTLVVRLTGAGYGVIASLPYNQTRYFKVIAVDTSGNVSAASDQTSTATQPLVNTDAISLIISGEMIPEGALVAEHIVASESLTAKIGRFLTLEAGEAWFNKIKADYIDFGSLYGELVTGLQIQTSTGPTTGVKLKNDSGIEVWNGWERTFWASPWGNVEMLGALKSGSSITTPGFTVSAAGSVWARGAFETGTGTGPRVTMSTALWGGQQWGMLQFHTGTSGWNPAQVWSVYEGGGGVMRLSSPYPTSNDWSQSAVISLSTAAGGAMRWISLAAQVLYMDANSYYVGSNGSPVDFHLQGTNIFQVATSGGRINLTTENGNNFAVLGAWSGSGSTRKGLLVQAAGQMVLSLTGTRNLTLQQPFNFPGVPSLIDGESDVALAWKYRTAANGYGFLHVTDWTGEARRDLRCGIIQTTSVDTSSDLAFKRNLTPLDGALALLLSDEAAPYEYDLYDRDPDTAVYAIADPVRHLGRRRGAIANTLVEVLPEVVSGEPGSYAVDPYGLTATLLAAFREYVDQTDARIADLERTIQSPLS